MWKERTLWYSRLSQASAWRSLWPLAEGWSRNATPEACQTWCKDVVSSSHAWMPCMWGATTSWLPPTGSASHSTYTKFCLSFTYMTAWDSIEAPMTVAMTAFVATARELSWESSESEESTMSSSPWVYVLFDRKVARPSWSREYMSFGLKLIVISSFS